MKLYESAEDYLERILILQNKQGVVHAVDIANDMNFSKPSVSVAMKKLRENGYVDIASNGAISLTESGYQVARSTYDRHLTLTEALVALGVQEEIARKDACKIEHDLSEESFQAIKQYINRR